MQTETLNNGIEIGAPVHFNTPVSGYGRSKVFSRMARAKGVTPDVGTALKAEKTGSVACAGWGPPCQASAGELREAGHD